MTLTKKQQNKPIPIELLSEISKSIIGYPKLVKNKEIDDTSNHEKYAVKIQFCGNVLISSKIIYLFCGKDLKQILINLIAMAESINKRANELHEIINKEKQNFQNKKKNIMQQLNYEKAKIEQELLEKFNEKINEMEEEKVKIEEEKVSEFVKEKEKIDKKIKELEEEKEKIDKKITESEEEKENMEKEKFKQLMEKKAKIDEEKTKIFEKFEAKKAKKLAEIEEKYEAKLKKGEKKHDKVVKKRKAECVAGTSASFSGEDGAAEVTAGPVDKKFRFIMWEALLNKEAYLNGDLRGDLRF